MPLSEKAIQNDKNSGTPLIKVKSIYRDKEFNCRGHITATDVVDLVRDTADKGLVEPIVVRHLWPKEEHLRKQGYEYSLVAGFRRHFSYMINEAEMIPALIRTINDDFECRDINAVENLQRQDLNILQEAKSIQHYILAGWNREDIGKRVSKSPGWCQAREELLNMPEEIQTAAAQGYLTQEDLKILYKHRKNKDQMLKMAGLMRDRRKLGLKSKDVLKKVNIKKSKFEQKIRKSFEIQEMMELIRNVSKTANFDKPIVVGDLFSEHGNSIITRLLAWATGYATNVEAYAAIEKLSGIIDADYEKPEFLEDVRDQVKGL